MIDRTNDRLTCTFPEIARQLRVRVGRQIGHILPEFLRLSVGEWLIWQFLAMALGAGDSVEEQSRR